MMLKDLPQEAKREAVRNLPLDCKGHKICIKQPFYQMECECECYKENALRLLAQHRNRA